MEAIVKINQLETLNPKFDSPENLKHHDPLCKSENFMNQITKNLTMNGCNRNLSQKKQFLGEFSFGREKWRMFDANFFDLVSLLLSMIKDERDRIKRESEFIEETKKGY